MGPYKYRIYVLLDVADLTASLAWRNRKTIQKAVVDKFGSDVEAWWQTAERSQWGTLATAGNWIHCSGRDTFDAACTLEGWSPYCTEDDLEIEWIF